MLEIPPRHRNAKDDAFQPTCARAAWIRRAGPAGVVSRLAKEHASVRPRGTGETTGSRAGVSRRAPGPWSRRDRQREPGAPHHGLTVRLAPGDGMCGAVRELAAASNTGTRIEALAVFTLRASADGATHLLGDGMCGGRDFRAAPVRGRF